MSAALFALLAALSAQARRPQPAPPWPSPPKVAESPRPMRPVKTATVRYVTTERAYFDRGARDGLRQGQSVEFTRLGRTVGSCAVDTLADASASCKAPGVRVGDGLRYSPAPAPKPPSIPPPVVQESPQKAAQSREAISRAPFPLVVSRAGTEVERHKLRATASVGDEEWVMINRPSTGFNAASVQLQIAGADLGAGFRLFVDATAYEWAQRPDGYRAPDKAKTQLFVSDLEIAQRELGRSWVLAAGRVWAYRAAGLGVFDGAQAGWRSRDGELEAGAFGGALPDPVTLAPSGSNPLVGAYAAWLHGQKDSALRWVDLEAHTAVLPRSGADTRVQLETLARVWVASVDLAGDVQLAPTGSEHVLEGARLDLAGNIIPTLHFALSGRYDALPNDVLTLPGETGPGHRSRRADLLLTWDALSGLSLGVDAGHVRDVDTNLWHDFIGPQVGLPRLFGGRGGLLAGYLEEGGDSPGRSAWLQASWIPAKRLYLLGRASWFQDRARSGDATFDELGLYLHGDWHFTRALWMRLSALGRLDLTTATSSSDLPVPLGIDATLALGGDF